MESTWHYNKIDVEPLSGALGAVLHGVDLSKLLDNETFSDIHQAFSDHLVIFFHDQHITIEQLKTFARRFGDLHVHPFTESIDGHPEVIEIVKEPEESHNWGDLWHTDLTVLEEPPLGSIIHAQEVPPFCGDTQWSNMYLAYETLSEGMKKLIDRLICIHDSNHSGYGNFRSMRGIDAEPIVREHPLVCVHPETGKKSLLLHRRHIHQFKGMTREESAPILAFLFDHAENPDFACRFRWKPDAVAFWDNRCTQHRVQADYFNDVRGFAPVRRRMRRVTVKGRRPVGAGEQATPRPN